MSNKTKRPLTNEAGDVRELEADDIRAMRPASEVLPADLVAILPKRQPGERGPQKAPTKVPVSIRLNRDVLEHFRSSGPGWQRRIADVLKKAAGLG